VFRLYELTNFGNPTFAAAPQLPSAALVGAAWTQTSDDPFFVEIDRSAPRHADSSARRGERRRRSTAFPTFSVDTLRRALLRFGGR